MSQINEKIGAWLLSSGNTKGKLANELGISRTSLRKKLYGNVGWSWEQAIEISKITNVPLDELAGINGKPDQM